LRGLLSSICLKVMAWPRRWYRSQPASSFGI
jgi:hypothetical protein